MALELLSVTNASIAVLGIPLSTLSLQDALFPESGTAFTDSPYSGAPYIFADACTLGDGSQNCTTACSLGGTMFANLQNLHNCMTFQTLSEHYEAKNLTKEATALVETLSIHATSPNSSLTLNITQQIQTCLVDYCASLPLCKDRYSTVDPYTSYDYISPYAPNSTFDLYRDGIGLVDNICISVPAPINSEIGGIGVRPPQSKTATPLTVSRCIFRTGSKLALLSLASWPPSCMTSCYIMDILAPLLYRMGSGEQVRKPSTCTWQTRDTYLG